MKMKLIIGNKNYSSWSLRAWLLLREAGIPFDEHRIALDCPDSAREIAVFSSAGCVPVLQLDDVTRWADTLELVESAGTLLVAHPGGESPARALEQVQPAESILLAIGPEGGWTDDEMSQAVAAGGRPIGLGSGVLRIETAAITLAGFYRLHFLGKS